jgi:hypothetical protein
MAPAATAPPEELEELVQGLSADYVSVISWTEFAEKIRGQEGAFHPQVKQIPYDAAKLLEDLRVTSAKVKLGTPKWTTAQKEEALERGHQQLANTHTDFLRGEFAAMIRKNQYFPSSNRDDTRGSEAQPSQRASTTRLTTQVHHRLHVLSHQRGHSGDGLSRSHAIW